MNVLKVRVIITLRADKEYDGAILYNIYYNFLFYKKYYYKIIKAKKKSIEILESLVLIFMRFIESE